MPPSLRIALAAALGVALAGEAAVLYSFANAETRLLLGMGIVAVVVGVTAVLARVTMAQADEVAPASRFHTRRFIRLRSYVEQFLEQVRRLHRIAVDTERGVRDRVSAEEEMDVIEDRLSLLVQEIRSAAGIEVRTGDPARAADSAGNSAGRS